jgi:Zn-finger nucleic acid-binding protein
LVQAPQEKKVQLKLHTLERKCYRSAPSMRRATLWSSIKLQTITYFITVENSNLGEALSMNNSNFQCPKCNSPMEKVSFQSVQVDRCTKCRGIWFDLLEKEDLKHVKDSEKIDIGNPSVGKEMNQKRKIDCPTCQSRMGRMVDLDHPNIEFESCDLCQGAFLDAGEFKALKDEEIEGFFKKLIKNI